MTPKTEEELERLAREGCERYYGEGSYVWDYMYAFKEGYKAHQSETDKTLEERLSEAYSAGFKTGYHEALADDKASEGGV